MLAALLVLGAELLALLAPQEAGSPNVVVILSDDQGTVDLGACGTEDVVTPNLDGLAARGVRFTQWYAAAPLCSPSRAALLTGRAPQRCGVPGNVSPGGPGLPGAEVTLAEALKAEGYATALIGKWHLGSREGESPLDQGFDRFFGHHKGCIDNWSHFFYWNGPNRHDLWSNREEHWEDGVHFGELVVREAVDFIREHRERPFFLFLPLNTPHYPLQPTAEWRERFRDVEAPRGEYLALLATMDEQIGAILGEIDGLGLRDRTLVVFQSDHGHSTEVRTKGGGGSAGPYRGAKFSLFEGGIRVPAIASWPGVLPQGEVRNQMAWACDWFPTILTLCRGERPAGVVLDGRDLGEVLGNPEAPSPHAALHWQSGNQWAVRATRWKLVARARTAQRKQLDDEDALWLADLEEDPAEAHNLAEVRPVERARLEALHARWASELGVVLHPPVDDAGLAAEDGVPESEGPVTPALVPVPGEESRAAAAGWQEGRPWMAQHEDCVALAAGGELDLVFLGDSISQGWGGPGRRVSQAAPGLWQEFYGQRRAATFGISGDRTQHLLWRVRNGTFEGASPELIVLMIGTNNLVHDPPEDVARGIEAIVHSLQELLPTSTILLHGTLPRGASRADPLRRASARVNELVAPLGYRDGVIWLDLAPWFLLEDGRADPALYRDDFLHLRPAGYRTWAEAIEPVVAARLSGLP